MKLPGTMSGALFLLLWMAGAAHAAPERLPVFVSVTPQKYFVERIGGERVDVQVMVHPGASPATYEPKPQQMVDLSQAKAYFAVGAPFESVWMRKIAAASPGMKIVHTDHGIRKRKMAAHVHGHDTDSPSGHHEDEAPASPENDAGGHEEHHGLDPHIWLSPPLVKIQSAAILAALKALDPAHGDLYDANFRQFSAQIDALDAELKAMFAARQGLRFMVFHPAWGYFADTYGIVQVPVEIEGKHPKPAELKALIEDARARDIRVIFVQPQFSTKSAGIVAREIGGVVVPADPLAEDWAANLREVAAKFQAALK